MQNKPLPDHLPPDDYCTCEHRPWPAKTANQTGPLIHTSIVRMAKFTFQLEPVLKARRAAEQDRQITVAKLERQRMQIEQSIRRRQEMLIESKRELRSVLVGTLNTVDLRGTAASSIRVMGQAQKLVLELAAVHKRLDIARADLIEATKQRRAVELLRDQRFAEWKREQSKKEDAFIDELAQRS
jgi:flagellar protein FliJ